MNATQPEFMFLLGSGVSCAAKLPNVQKLSCAIASEATASEANLLDIIKNLAGAIHGDGRHTYEDWFYVADQILQHETGEFENPGLLPLMERLRCSLELNNVEIMTTAGRLCSMIASTVRRELRAQDAQPNAAYAGLEEAIFAHPRSKFRFFSLNHDLLLERYLRDVGIMAYLCRAPHPETKGYDRVQFSQREFTEAQMSVIKLHGSIDWRRVRPRYTHSRKPSDPFREEFLGIFIQEDVRFEPMEDEPRALTGTFNKVLQYGSPTFLPLFAQFQQCLQESNRVVVCGYGFGDKGINSLLIDWMCQTKKPRLIVIDPNPFDIVRCRRAIFEKVENWKDDGRLQVIQRSVGADDMKWTEILKIPHV